MSTVEANTRYTPEDLLLMEDADRYELVDGELVERDVGSESSWIGGELYRRISNFSHESAPGWALPADAGYQCFPEDPNKLRKPDTSFILRGRLPGERLPKGWIPIAPDLAVEVLSPHDPAWLIDVKVEEFLGAGATLVWVVSPEARLVTVHRADGSVTKLHADDELSGEDVLPGFRCRVGDIFPSPTTSV